MDWAEARDNTLRYWRELRGSLDRLDEVDLLRDINAVCELCDKSKEEAAGRWGRCDYCIAHQQFGGCLGISLKMSEAVVDHDRETLRRLVDEFIANLEQLDCGLVSHPPAEAQ